MTFERQLRGMKQNASYGQTGRHVRGRGIERTDGTFSDETPKETVAKDITDKPKTPKP